MYSKHAFRESEPVLIRLLVAHRNERSSGKRGSPHSWDIPWEDLNAVSSRTGQIASPVSPNPGAVPHTLTSIFIIGTKFLLCHNFNSLYKFRGLAKGCKCMEIYFMRKSESAFFLSLQKIFALTSLKAICIILTASVSILQRVMYIIRFGICLFSILIFVFLFISKIQP